MDVEGCSVKWTRTYIVLAGKQGGRSRLCFWVGSNWQFELCCTAQCVEVVVVIAGIPCPISHFARNMISSVPPDHAPLPSGHAPLPRPAVAMPHCLGLPLPLAQNPVIPCVCPKKAIVLACD